jgi:hypothetical protein
MVEAKASTLFCLFAAVTKSKSHACMGPKAQEVSHCPLIPSMLCSLFLCVCERDFSLNETYP